MAAIDGRPAGAGTGRACDAAQREQQHERERHLREEDRLPAEELREDAAGGRAERGAEHARGDPDAQRALVARSRLREEIERGGDDERGADRLDAARADEHVERRREPAGERRRGEDDDAARERLARPASRRRTPPAPRRARARG